MASFRVEYPAAQRLNLVEDLFGHQVADPYRWLEDPDSPQTAEWLAAEESLWDRYRAGLTDREAFADRVRELLRVGSVGLPAWRGTTQFYTRRDPDQEHGVLYVADGAPGADAASRAGAEATERALIDLVALDPSGRTTLDAWQPDKEGRLLAYQLSHGGDEESLLRVLDVATGELIDGPIDRCRYSGVAWLPGGKAFYYVRRLPPDAVPEGEAQYHRRVYLHQVGTSPESDVEVFGAGRDKTTYYGASVSMDGRWLIISASIGTAPREDIWIADLTAGDPASPLLVPLMVGLDAQASPRIGRDGRLYVLTDLNAPRGRLCVADPAAPGPEGWRDLIPEDATSVLRSYAILDDLPRPTLIVSRMRHAVSEVAVHDLASGDRLSGLDLPGIGSAGGIAERPEGGHEAWFGYTDYATPPIVLRYDAVTGELSTWAKSPGAVATPRVTASQVTYRSADGTEVRMVVIEPRGEGGQGDGEGGETARPAERSCILYGYGGFDISMTPGYSANILAWVEAGGVYAVAALRGGSEEGEEWHRAGMLDRKQNVFDDFHAAAEHLIATGVTSPARLAVWGGSNGGLLVGAAVTQRPELFSAAVCSAPLLDMVRYERFKIGETWNTEYGTASSPVELEWLLGYSPYHHVVDGAAYPSVLFTVFSNDTRVDPLHGYKMCAALQHATSSGRPVLLRAEGQVGHGQRAVSLSASLAGDCLAFVARETGLRDA